MPTLTDHLAGLMLPTESAAALGYRLPAEFEPVEALWLTYPHNLDTWPRCFEEACKQYDHFIAQAKRFTKVNVIGKGRDFEWTTNDSWVRDYGPIFVVRKKGQGPGAKGQGADPNPQSSSPLALGPSSLGPAPLACHDFTFNGWGGKYDTEDYNPALDDIIPRFVAKHLDIPIWTHDLILEGGSIDVNGRGSLLTTKQCLLNVNRNSKLTQPQIEAKIHAALGTRHIIWLPGGIEGDDTDGHIDDVARFIAPDTVASLRAPKENADHEMLENNWRALQQARDQDGKKLNLVALPVPEPMFHDYPPIGNDEGGHYQIPASYANFLILNEGVLVPVFGQKSDEVALRTLEEAMPGKQIVGVRAEKLVVGFGALHCLSMQQPRA
ncbi:MAG: agmatine deiminase family protein [Phycisphaeraceae bacterium]